MQRLYEAFGPHRYFWGTDITRMPCSYAECVSLFTEELPWLTGDDFELRDGPRLVRMAGLAPVGRTSDVGHRLDLDQVLGRASD